VRKLLAEIGLESNRIQMINVSAAMGGQFAWSAAEFTEEIRQLGPNPLRKIGTGAKKPSKETIPEVETNQQ
jgi:coenzyme F420-reducing hydrogenase delta subunit